MSIERSKKLSQQQAYEDPRIQRTKKLIVDAFLALAKEKEFHSISIKDITNHATINRATFYRHFPDKYALLEEIVHQIMMQQTLEQLQKQTALNEHTFQMIVYSFCDLVEKLQLTFERNYDTIIQLSEHTLKHKLIDLLLPFFHSNNAEKNKFHALMLVTSIYSASCAWIRNQDAMTREAFFQMILPFLMGATRPR